MKIGVQFDGFSDLGASMAAVREAEEAGASSLWFAQHLGYREAFVSAMAAACTATRPTIVPLSISPYMTPPLMCAMSIASIAEMAPGRTELSISVGNLMDLGQSGREASKPLGTLRDYIGSVRSLLAGDPVTTETTAYRTDGAHMGFAKGLTLPIHIATTGPQMLRLAGEVGDGVVLSVGLTPATMRKNLAEVEAGSAKVGRARDAVRRIGLVFFCVSEDGVTAKRILLRKLSYLFRSPAQAENIGSGGLDIDHAGIMAAISRRDPDAAAALMPEEAALVFGAAGTPAECRRRLEDYLAVGLDEVVLAIGGDGGMSRLALGVLSDFNRSRGAAG